MSLDLAVDPGKHQAGASLWLGGKLIACTYTTYSAEPRACAQKVVDWVFRTAPGGKPYRLFFEYPQIYREANQKHKDPNDLLPLAEMLGGVGYAFPGASVTEYRPREWKGTIPKREDDEYIVARRVQAKLAIDPTEIAVAATYAAGMPENKRHNLWDAIGIGLHGLGRGIMDKERVIHR